MIILGCFAFILCFYSLCIGDINYALFFALFANIFKSEYNYYDLKNK